MITTKVDFLVQSPIYGYNGMGYGHLKFLEKIFTTEREAVKWARKCNKVYHDDYPQSASGDKFGREMTDNVSYCFTGESVIKKRTVISEILKY